MMEFIVIAILFTVLCGFPLSILLVGGLKNWKRCIIAIIIAIGFGVSCSG